MPTSFHPPVPTLRGWFRSAYRQFEPCERTVPGLAAAPDIALEDWDLLFRAALDVLAREAAQPTGPDTGKDVGVGTSSRTPTTIATAPTPLQPPGTVLRECLEALDHLRRSAPRCSGSAARQPDRPVVS